MFPRICFVGVVGLPYVETTSIRLVAVEQQTTKLKLRVYNQAKRGYDMICYDTVWYGMIKYNAYDYM